MSDDVIEQPAEFNNQLVLVNGVSGSGKSASLRNIKNQCDWLYMNTESGKRLPFRNKFQTAVITDPFQVEEGFRHAIENPDEVSGIVLDSMTFLMDMYESMYVLNSANTMKAWGDFSQFFKRIMQQHVPNFGKPTIIIAHTLDTIDEANGEVKTSVPIKGSLKNNGVEAYFSTVVSTKKMKIKDLKDFHSDLLNISEEEEALGFKYVFQTRLTKTTVGERIRSPMGLFTKEQTYIDNDVQLLLNHLNAYYAD